MKKFPFHLFNLTLSDVDRNSRRRKSLDTKQTNKQKLMARNFGESQVDAPLWVMLHEFGSGGLESE